MMKVEQGESWLRLAQRCSNSHCLAPNDNPMVGMAEGADCARVEAERSDRRSLGIWCVALICRLALKISDRQHAVLSLLLLGSQTTFVEHCNPITQLVLCVFVVADHMAIEIQSSKFFVVLPRAREECCALVWSQCRPLSPRHWRAPVRQPFAS